MSLELLNTLASVGTFVVIATTAIAAVIQLRHMRANNQLQGLLDVLVHIEDEEFNKRLSATQQMLPKMMADPQYVQSMLDGTFDRDVAWLELGNRYERAGSLLKFGLIPEAPFMDVNSGRTVQVWELMLPVTSLLRKANGPRLWENFEYIAMRAKLWNDRHQDGNYPKGTVHAVVPPFVLQTNTGSPADSVRNVSSPRISS